MASAFWETGVEPVGVSAISSTGVGELLDKCAETRPRRALFCFCLFVSGSPRPRALGRPVASANSARSDLTTHRVPH